MIYHLSHIDLDGYGCQYITKNLYPEKDIVFENSNYGLEIERKLKFFLEKIDKRPEEKSQILITDLNLTDEIAEWLDNEVSKRDNLSLTLLDHHISGAHLSEKYAWYSLNADYCATYLTYLYFKDMMIDNEEYMKSFAEYVNVTDLWIEEDERFNMATFLSNQIFSGFRFPQIVNYLNHKYKMHLIKYIFDLILKGHNIREIEEQMFYIKEEFLKGSIADSHFSDNNESLDLKYYYMIFTIIKNYKYKRFNFNGATGMLVYDIGSSLFQYFSNFYNKEINDVDFLMHVERRGRMSLRSRGDSESHNVSKIATEYFNGGGHFNASGGSIEPLTDNHKKYNKREVEEILTKITS